MLVLEYALWLIVIAVATAVILSKNLLKSLVYLAIFSLVSASLYLLMQAPDVAMTEAAIGAAISTIFILAAIRSIGEKEEKPRRNVFLAAFLILGFAFAISAVIADLPAYGAADSAANRGSAEKYISQSYGQTAIPNVVTAVLASYRGFDTLGEVYVILAATLCVLLILPTRKETSDAT